MHRGKRTWQMFFSWLGMALGLAGLAGAVLAGDRLEWEFRALSASVGFTIIVVGWLFHKAASACQELNPDSGSNQKR